jgi:aldose 1-epimerase
MESKDGPALKLTYTSPDGQENYPGTLKMAVTYTVTDKNEVRIDYDAETDKATPINLTNHSYFNLAGGGNVLGHELMVNATQFTPSDDTLIPTGEIKSVKGTPLDFTESKAIGEDIGKLLDQPHRGYDHNFVLDNGGKVALAARVFDPKSGRVMEVLTDQPAVQLYTANFLEETRGKGGSVYGKHGGFCLETQHYPDSVNHSNFPSTILRPGEKYRTTTIHRFSVG